MGYAALFGHSAHIFHGIEVYQGRPIFYSTGDLVDDYAVDPEFENDGQLLFEVSLSGLAVREIALRPVFIDDCRTAFAEGREFERITRRAVTLCADMDTLVRRDNERLIITNGTRGEHEAVRD
jgi:poly-gamma-glutamate synthesis protein (capsule biosynthesis protein)